ncbi:GldG family protein [Synoicihabitans lomoniglobus]|uniref:GldG family protein n=1 Tax=Synoicihabitans lomoniglobus TaxID=2909285 RepID=A0AAF0CGG6_9BACT|nr:GldG family protein [Opitutaceae bacterium LMO-M01]WED63587.1 GldG family protein [Opitutaceae bacterium LMO-M01]
MAARNSFAIARWRRTINLVLQAALFLTLFGGLNYLALHHGWRWDLTNHRRHTLSEETKANLRSLEQPVRIIVTIDPHSTDPDLFQANRDIRGMLREYVNYTQQKSSAIGPAGRVTVEELDVYKNQREAEQLQIDQPNVVLALCGDRRKMIPLSEFYEIREGAAVAFRGEQVITSAILSVSNPNRPHIYFLAGHGEMQPGDVDPSRGLSVWAEELRLRNLTVSVIDLSQTKAVPDDAALVVIAAPQGRYSPVEVELLRRYLADRAGRVFILLAPVFRHGLDDLLYDWGLVADDVIIAEPNPANVTELNELRINAFAPHPVTQPLIDNQFSVFLGPLTRVVRPDPGRPLDNSLRAEVLAATSESAWGERDYRQQNVTYNPGIDLKGLPGFEPRNRLGVAVSSERVTPPKDLPFSVRGGRMVLFGNADFLSNSRIAAPGNLAIALNTVEWCIDRDVDLNTLPRPIERYQINLSQADLGRLRISLLFILPGLAALFGFVIYWTRRS